MRWSLTPRAAVVLAAAVVAVALVVVGVSTLGARSSGEVTVTSGPSTSVASSRPSAGTAGTGAVDRGAPASASPGASASAASSDGAVAVYVLGAVAHAGVVEVPAGTRVEVVLERVGGAAADADLARLNLARPVVDGERLYVPRVGETEVPEVLGPDVAMGGSGGAGGAAPGGTSGPAGVDAVVDLNTADQTTLETLPGIGPALAGRILSWREEHGGFTSVDDLLEVSGIGEARMAELRDRVRV